MDPDRSDLDPYRQLVIDLGARSAIDIGCGTGTFALVLAATGMTVIGVDPARASLDVAKSKPGSERVTWIHGDATSLQHHTTLGAECDMAVMTANVAQVFLTDEEFGATLRAIAGVIRPGGHLVFEVRDPARRAWEHWHGRTNTQPTSNEGAVTSRTVVTGVRDQLVSFRQSYRFTDGTEVHSDSTLRFRERSEIDALLRAAGFDVVDVRDAPDRPGLEWVFVAQRAHTSSAEAGDGSLSQGAPIVSNRAAT